MGIQAGAAALLPSPTKCQEFTYDVINSNALAGATANAPPDKEPKRFRELRNEMNKVNNIPNNNGCFTRAVSYTHLRAHET